MRKIYVSLVSACFIGLLVLQPTNLQAQQKFNADTVKAGKFDMGKMWTFDYPPIEYFKQTYQFTPNQQWFDKARLSALRFANYCSASFVSEDGLVMTNHHCARESGFNVQKAGENFNEKGFYAPGLADERKVPDLYVDQLQKIEDVTSRITGAMEKVSAGAEQAKAEENEINAVKEEYKNKPDWKGLELQVITFYNGGKYALYGYKRYTDVRLVFMPELNLGFFGGDYDNFTYPRYDLDCSFFRVYDDNGKPLKTTNFFKFSQTPVNENDPVFIIGNPGSTGRLWTMSDLEYRRDTYLPLILNYLKNVSKVLTAYNQKAKSDSLVNMIFEYENSIKAYGGELDGLNDQYLMARKAAFERNFKNDAKAKPALAPKLAIWDSIAKLDDELKKALPATFLFSPNANHVGNTFTYAFVIAQYMELKKTDEKMAAGTLKRISRIPSNFIPEVEEGTLTNYLTELSNVLGKDDEFVSKALKGKSPAEAAKALLSSTKLNDPKTRAKLATGDSAFLAGFSDPVLDLAKIAAPRYLNARQEYMGINELLDSYHGDLGRLVYDLYDTQIPPDATFSLRIADGVVKGYDYNGTKAPWKTTFYGLYDRYYSFNKTYPWSLPGRWLNPPKELLPLPMDFASTNDIIGGNSGSPVINKNLEVVGLVFDGNIESLPGRFIYVPDANRSVSVTATGMLGALKYIYKAKRLYNELTK